MLAISNLEFDYGNSDYSLSVPTLKIDSGDKVAIAGPSGAGKTSLLHLLTGLARPRSGEIQFDAFNVCSMRPVELRNMRAQSFGLVFQEFELLEHLNVIDNILLPFRINRTLELTVEIRDRAAWLAESVGLDSMRKRNIRALSQGERQRVAICRALLNRPRIVLADEPTGNLDHETATQTLELILTTADACDAAVILVTHDESLLPRFDRTIRFTRCTRDATEEGRHWTAQFSTSEENGS